MPQLILPLGSVLKSLDSPAECELSDTPRWANSAVRWFLSDRTEPMCLERLARLPEDDLAADCSRCNLRSNEDRFGVGGVGDSLC